jgi:hypothetical protein
MLIGQHGLRHFLRYRPLLPIGWRAVQIVRQRRRKMTALTPFTLEEFAKEWRRLNITFEFQGGFVDGWGKIPR